MVTGVPASSVPTCWAARSGSEKAHTGRLVTTENGILVGDGLVVGVVVGVGVGEDVAVAAGVAVVVGGVVAVAVGVEVIVAVWVGDGVSVFVGVGSPKASGSSARVNCR